MSVSHGRRGASFERKVAEELREAGWYVTRSAGSHGAADLIAISPDEVAFVQAKLGGPGAFAPASWNELYALAMHYGAVPLVAHRPKRGRIEFLRMLDEKLDRGTRGPAAPCEPWEPVAVAA